MRIFSKLPESVHSRQQCSAYYFVTGHFCKWPPICCLHRTSAKKPRLRGKNVVIGIPSKFNCDSESRAVFVECAQALTRYKNKSPWIEGILRRKPKKVAVIAIANKLARQVWAMANKGESFKQMTILTA